MALAWRPTHPPSSSLGCHGSQQTPADHYFLRISVSRTGRRACLTSAAHTLSGGASVCTRSAVAVAGGSDFVTGKSGTPLGQHLAANRAWWGGAREPLSQRSCSSGRHSTGVCGARRRCRETSAQAGQGGPSASAAAGAGTATLETSQEVEQAPFIWAQNWFVVATEAHLDPTVPHAVTLLGRDLVLWRDAGGTWRTFLDECPHRRAPLSDGRIDERGNLYCCYHGWSFEGTGKCRNIPQAPLGSVEAQAVNNPRSACTTFPTLVDSGLVFVWPDEFSPQLAAKSPAPTLPANAAGWSTFVRELPVSWEYLMENIVDVSHLPVAHHSVGTLKRTNANPIAYKLLAEDRSGFETFAPNEPTFTLPASLKVAKIDLSNKLVAPTLFIYNRLMTKTDGTSVPGFCLGIHCTPLAEGRSLISISTRGSNRGALQTAILGLVPWFGHVMSHAVLDGDTYFLHCQQRALHGKEKRWSQECFVPTGADRTVIAFRKWFTTHGGGRVDYFPGGQVAGVPPRLSKEQALDRYKQHTERCSTCQAGLKTLGRVGLGAGAGAVVALLPLVKALGQLLVLGALGPNTNLVAVGASTILAAALAYVAFFCKKTEKLFYYVGWDHAKRP